MLPKSQKFWIDTEFIEGTQKSFFGNTEPTIDLISLAIVDEYNRELYLISKEFNLDEAWNRWEQRTGEGDRNNLEPRYYWIRENVLRPIHKDLSKKHLEVTKKIMTCNEALERSETHVYRSYGKFTKRNLGKLLDLYGYSRNEIRYMLAQYLLADDHFADHTIGSSWAKGLLPDIQFYGWYASYDWVVFCWLFGKMNELPKGMPMYINDLKQMFDQAIRHLELPYKQLSDQFPLKFKAQAEERMATMEEKIEFAKLAPEYPEPTGFHSAIHDARWNKKLYHWLDQIPGYPYATHLKQTPRKRRDTLKHSVTQGPDSFPAQAQNTSNPESSDVPTSMGE